MNDEIWYGIILFDKVYPKLGAILENDCELILMKIKM